MLEKWVTPCLLFERLDHDYCRRSALQAFSRMLDREMRGEKEGHVGWALCPPEEGGEPPLQFAEPVGVFSNLLQLTKTFRDLGVEFAERFFAKCRGQSTVFNDDGDGASHQRRLDVAVRVSFCVAVPLCAEQAR